MDFVEEFKARGFFHQATDENTLKELMSKKKIPVYIGFDCTANSLHVGSLMQIMIFKMLQRHGHKPLVIMGGGTTKIGDPSGKDEARKMLNDQDILDNMQGIRSDIAKFVKFGDGKSDAKMINNDEWLSEIKYIDFLREYGKHFSINRMLTFESVKIRLEREQNLSFLEFNYMLLQAYDFVELNKNYDCVLQIGGSDQWGNIINGVELGRRVGCKHDLYGLTTPLITTSSGAKMGKTANGAVWLSEERLSPYDYFQFWRNTDDADVIKFMKLFTELSLDKIEQHSKAEGNEINEVKKILAFEATKLCHGEEKAHAALKTAEETFEKGGLGTDLPEITIEESELSAGIPAFKALQMTNLCSSGGEARRLIKGKGARINDQVIDDENQTITLEDLKDGVIKISAGKKKHALIKI